MVARGGGAPTPGRESECEVSAREAFVGGALFALGGVALISYPWFRRRFTGAHRETQIDMWRVFRRAAGSHPRSPSLASDPFLRPSTTRSGWSHG